MDYAIFIGFAGLVIGIFVGLALARIGRHDRRESAESWSQLSRRADRLREEYTQRPVAHRIEPQVRTTPPRPPTVGPKGGAGDSGASDT